MTSDKEKLIDLIRECDKECDVVIKCKEECKHSGKGYPLCFHDKIADRLFANGATVHGKGEWINSYINRYGHPCHCCSVCGFKASYQDKNFCPNCGADMRGE